MQLIHLFHSNNEYYQSMYINSIEYILNFLFLFKIYNNNNNYK